VAVTVTVTVAFEVFVLVTALVVAVRDALLAAWLLLVDDVHPAIDNVATITRTIIANSFLIIQVPLDEKMNQKRKTRSMKLKNCYP
jgi:hypothetical protein